MGQHGRKRRGLVRRAVDASVWGPNAIAADDERVRGLLRVAFPAVDIALFLFGAGSAASGVPALRDVFDPIYAGLWSAAIAVAALWCLIGVAFPAHLWKIERGGKALLAWLLAVYAGALMYAGIITDDLGRAAVGFVPAAVVPFLVWRILDVSKDAKRNGWRGAAR